MLSIIVDGKKFLELKLGERNSDILNSKDCKIGDTVYYSTYDDNLQNEKLVKKVIGDISERANKKVRVTFIK